jgi:hypothetical protein
MGLLDLNKPIQYLICFGLVAFICVGVLATVVVAALMNQTVLLTRNLNPFSREALFQ